MTPPDKPRVTVAVDDPQLLARVRQLLEDQEFDVEIQGVDDPSEVQANADLVVMDEETAPSQEEFLDLGEEAPGIIVVGRGVDEAERAGLIAAGAAGVVDPVDQGARLVDLARAETQGGLDGPEVGGAEVQPLLADFASRNPGMRAFVDLVRRVADSESTLLVHGPTGAGKERLARAIHAESGRRGGPFVAVNCGALPENLLESELFGHVRGAFTGANSERKGHFELARGGTLLLDEIGEMPPHLQVKLLTVLQRRVVRPIGSEVEVAVDARVMAATNRDLREEVAAGRFREDLLYRLNVVTLRIPPLRERPEDIADLTGTIIRHFRTEAGLEDVAGISEAAMERLLAHDWPGNVRELTNVLERAMLLCRGEEIGVDDLPPELSGGSPGHPRPRGTGSSDAPPDPWLEMPLKEAKRRAVERFERRYFETLLEHHGGHVGRTADSAGINPRTLYDKLTSLGIDRKRFRAEP